MSNDKHYQSDDQIMCSVIDGTQQNNYSNIYSKEADVQDGGKKRISLKIRKCS